MTALQWIAVTVGLIAVTGILGVLVLYVFDREDRRQERDRAKQRHPGRRDRVDPWDEDGNL